LRDRSTVLRRVVVLSTYVLRAFSAMNGNAPRPDETRSFLRRHDLLDELRPAERELLLLGGEPSASQVSDASWRSEALVALRWAIGDRDTLDVGGQVSLVQAVPDVDSDDQVRALFATANLRPEPDLRRALQLWFVVAWRLRLRRHGVTEVDLRRWVAASPYLDALTVDDLPLIDDDLSLDAAAVSVAADELGIEEFEWTDRVPVRACTAGLLISGENVLRVTEERLRALRWLFGVTPDIDAEPLGLYRPDRSVGADKAVLYGPDAPPAAADLAAYDPWGGQALHRAAWRGDPTALHAALDGGADATTPDIDGDYPIHCAVLGGHRPLIEAVIAAEPFVVHIPDGRGRLPLHLAAARGDVGAIEALAGDPDLRERGIDATDADAATALQEAIRHGHADAADRLIAYGAALDGAMAAAVDGDRADMVALLADRGVEVDAVEDGVTPMYRALFAGRLAAARALLERGADAGFTHASGTSALQVAADRGATDVCLDLIDRGADIDHRLQDLTAVGFAFLGGHTDCALALIERGADVTDPLLDLAVRGGAAPLIRWCLDRGEVVGDGQVSQCAGDGRADALAALLAAGADPGRANAAGVAPLHLAADRGHRDCVEALLRAGAPVDQPTTEKGFTALHLAAMRGHDDCVTPLLAAGASRSAVDTDGHDALAWAVDGGHDACVALLAPPQITPPQITPAAGP
jgi:ankyrin repeat protein